MSVFPSPLRSAMTVALIVAPAGTEVVFSVKVPLLFWSITAAALAPDLSVPMTRKSGRPSPLKSAIPYTGPKNGVGGAGETVMGWADRNCWPFEERGSAKLHKATTKTTTDLENIEGGL